MATESNRVQGSHETPRHGSPCLEPKHKIFLSHSGKQKNFTAQLCVDLMKVNHFPFFDKLRDSLPKGEEFPPLLIKAARQCRVAILVLSKEFFTRTKWPMIELNEFVQAQAGDNRGLKLLPLYFGLKLEELNDAGNQKRWRKVWEKWARKDKRIDVGKWVQALSKVLGPVNGMEYDGVDEVAFRKNVVEAVCKLIPADVRYDVSHVQAQPQLYKVMKQRMDEAYERSRCRGVGLFGTGGMGKTTISKVMCNEMSGEFGGKVCHIEFNDKNYVELRKKVLRELTGADQEHLCNEGDKLLDQLKRRMHEQKVFLSVDNVLSGDDIREANLYLDIEYLHGSKVLVTSRSPDVLKSLRLRDEDCEEMPELVEQDARDAFLYYARCKRNSFGDSELGIIRRCVEVCRFSMRDLNVNCYFGSARQYLPLALKVWGTQLGDISEDPLRWRESLGTLNEHMFNHSKEAEHPLFSLMRQGYDKFGETEQHIFLDLAIMFPRRFPFDPTDYNIVVWLSILHRRSKNSIVCSLDALTKKGLLEYSVRAGSAFKIHDLYLVFAREEARAGPFGGRRIYACEGLSHAWEGHDFFVERPAFGFWPSLKRLTLHHLFEVKCLTKEILDLCCNVEMLQMRDCLQLVEVDVGGMKNLRVLDVVGCGRLGEKFWGVEKLANLAWFRWRNIDEEVAPFVLELSLTALQVLHLGCVSWRHKSDVLPNVSGCTNLCELTMDGFGSLRSFPDLSKLSKLERISLCYAYQLRSVLGLSSLTNLQVLSLHLCSQVTELPGLCDLIALETLNLTDVGVAEIPDLEKLVRLQSLNVPGCKRLSSLDGLEHLTSLRRLDASGTDNVTVLPDCSKLKGLEAVDLSFSGVCIVRQSDFERLAKHRILKIERCVGLLEPLVVWLLVRRGQLAWEAVCERLWWCKRPSVTDHSESSSRESERNFGGVCTEAHDVQSNSGEIEIETGGFSAEADHARSITEEDFVHYLNEVVSVPRRTPCQFGSGGFEGWKFLESAHILEDLDGGIDGVIKALRENDDLGILSLVVAKYVDRDRSASWPIRPLCEAIIRYLEVLDEGEIYLDRPVDDGKMERAHLGVFILERLTMCEALSLELGRQHNLDVLFWICVCSEENLGPFYTLSRVLKRVRAVVLSQAPSALSSSLGD